VDFIGNDYVVAHNSEFDFSVLAKASEEAGVTLPDMSHFCTLRLAKRALPRLKRHRLGDIAEALDIGNFSAHDTEANALVAAMICTRLADREELSSLSHIMSKYGVREGQIGLGQGYYIPAEPAVAAVEAPVAPAPVVKVSKPVEAPVAVVVPEPVTAPVVKPVVEAPATAPTAALSTVKGQRISFVGGFELEERAAAKEAIAAQGGKYLKNVRPDTTLLVIGTHHNPNLEGIVVAKAFNDQGSKIAFMNKDAMTHRDYQLFK
jgi:DNA polymerase-3 subunit epsilon